MIYYAKVEEARAQLLEWQRRADASSDVDYGSSIAASSLPADKLLSSPTTLTAEGHDASGLCLVVVGIGRAINEIWT